MAVLFRPTVQDQLSHPPGFNAMPPTVPSPSSMSSHGTDARVLYILDGMLASSFIKERHLLKLFYTRFCMGTFY